MGVGRRVQGDMMSVKRRARKNYKCSFCTEQIPAGIIYVYIRLTPWDHGINDGFYTWRAHDNCWEFWGSVYGTDCDWEWDDSDLQDKDEFTTALHYAQSEGES